MRNNTQNGIIAGVNEIANVVRDQDGNIVSYNDTRVKIDVSTGVGDDEVNLIFVNGTEIVVPDEENTGASGGASGGGSSTQENIKIKIDLSASNVDIDTGEGADTVTLEGRSKLDSISTVALQVLINGVYEAATEFSRITETTNGDRVLPQTEVKIDGGAGDDLYNVDSTFAFSSFRGVDLIFAEDDESNPYFDRVHLTGKVGDSYLHPDDDRLTYNASTNTVGMTANAQVSLLGGSIDMSNLYAEMRLILNTIDAVTDILEGKVEVEASMSEMANIQFESFKNYIIDNYNGKTGAGQLTSFFNNSGAGTMLTNLCIGSDDDLIVGNVSAPNVNIVLTVENNAPNNPVNITIEGNVEGRSVLMFMEKTDSHKLVLVENDLQDEEDSIGIEASLLDIVSGTSVKIAAGAVITAAKAVGISISSKQTQGLIPTIEDLIPGYDQLDEFERQGQIEQWNSASNLNFIAIKVGSAIVDILGNISAGAIHTRTASFVDTDSTNAALRSFGMPLAIGVVVSEAGVNIAGNAVLTTTVGGVVLQADSQVELTTEAKSGRLPFTLALSVVDNKAYVDINGNAVINAAGDLSANAYGTVQTRTVSTGTNEMPQTTTGNYTGIPNPNNIDSNTIPSCDSNKLDVGKSGGFFTISVVDQDVFTLIRDNVSVITGAALSLNSGAYVHTVNEARSNPNEGGSSMTFDQLLRKFCGDGTSGNTGIFTQLANKFSGSGTPGSTTTPGTTTPGGSGTTATQKNQTLSIMFSTSLPAKIAPRVKIPAQATLPIRAQQARPMAAETAPTPSSWSALWQSPMSVTTISPI